MAVNIADRSGHAAGASGDQVPAPGRIRRVSYGGPGERGGRLTPGASAVERLGARDLTKASAAHVAAGRKA